MAEWEERAFPLSLCIKFSAAPLPHYLLLAFRFVAVQKQKVGYKNSAECKKKFASNGLLSSLEYEEGGRKVKGIPLLSRKKVRGKHPPGLFIRILQPPPHFLFLPGEVEKEETISTPIDVPD